MKHILLAGDVNVLKYLYVVMKSVITNVKGEITFHIFYPKDSAESYEILEVLSKDFKIKRYGIDDEVLSPLATVAGKRWPAAAFYPLLASQVLSNDIKRIVSLDSDTLVVDSIDELFEIPFDDKAIIATSSWISGYGEQYTPRSISWNFNSGMYVINLDKWRTLGVDVQFFKYGHAELIRKKSSLFDQDLLNEAFSISDTKYINKAYNVAPSKYYEAQQSLTFEGVKIIHFTNNRYFEGKPWDIKFDKKDVSNKPYHYYYKITQEIYEIVNMWWMVASTSPWFSEWSIASDARKSLYRKRLRPLSQNISSSDIINKSYSKTVEGFRQAMMSDAILEFEPGLSIASFYNVNSIVLNVLTDIIKYEHVQDGAYVVIPFYKQLKKGNTYKISLTLNTPNSDLHIYLRRNHNYKQSIGEIKQTSTMSKYSFTFIPDKSDYFDVGLIQSNAKKGTIIEIKQITIIELFDN